MEKNNVVYYKKEHIGSKEWSDLDFLLREHIGFDYEKHDKCVEISNKTGMTGTCPMDIDKILSQLKKMRKKGATHVSLDYHIDHIGYVMDNWKVTPATKEEVDKFNKRMDEVRAERIEKRKEELKRQLKLLENKK